MSILLGVSPATAAINKRQTYAAVTCPYTTTANDQNLTVSGTSGTITLNTAVGNQGQVLSIVHNGTSLSQVYTFVTTGGQTIGGIASGSYAFYTFQESFRLVSDGSNWLIEERNTSTGWNTISTVPVTSTSAHTFTITSSSVTAGAVYSNNGSNFTASATIAPSTTLLMAGSGTPAASGTLTLVSGTGPATIAFSAVSNSPPVKGVTSIDQYQWRRTGSSVDVWYQLVFTGTGTAGSGDYVFDFSSIGSFASSVLISLPTATATGGQNQATIYVPYRLPASGLVVQNGTSSPVITDIVPYSSTSYKVGGIAGGFLGSASLAFSAIIGYTIKFTVPVLGWQP